MNKVKKVLPFVFITILVLSNAYFISKVYQLNKTLKDKETYIENNIERRDIENQTDDIQIDIAGKVEYKLYDYESIANLHDDYKYGYIKISNNSISFQEVKFDYDEKAILYVKENIDKDFVPYTISDDAQIYLIEFDDFTTKYKKVDFTYLKGYVDKYESIPYYVKINNGILEVICEMYLS